MMTCKLTLALKLTFCTFPLNDYILLQISMMSSLFQKWQSRFGNFSDSTTTTQRMAEAVTIIIYMYI